ncbi:unnamed protein product [Trifolium pratense]|uniref:Uncharacterized protein n=1 Tax=Trifolium pratense TaxID=57577 RepID=A0ACB0IVK9_TRIPR|nr:unnamed protein product [Trifolium pratense]
MKDKVLVERKGFAFLVNIEYENLPDFCTNCKVIGHYVANCKKLIPIDDGKFDKDTRDRRTTNKEPKKVFVPTKEGRQGQGTSKGIANVEKTNENNDELVIVETDKDLADKSLNPKPHDQQRDNSSNNGKDKEVANMNDQFNIIGNSNHSPQADKSQCSTSQGNKTIGVASPSMTEFMVLKNLNVNLHPPKPTVLKEVFWQSPLEHWVKCNTDGASNSFTSSCGGIFRNHNADFLCCFAENTGLKSAFMAEICGAMRAIELANCRNWKNLWLESDSTLVVMTFNSSVLVPWELSNRWRNCLRITRSMNFVVSHVYREGNQCADGLTNIGLTIDRFTIWNELPQQISGFFVDNSLGKPSFRLIRV